MRLDEVSFEREGELEDVVYRGTAAFTAMLEAAIRELPEQYLWQHRRWKTRPPRPDQEPRAEERKHPQG
jgi:KDO2-lipid IV(A) lauroyltransferase